MASLERHYVSTGHLPDTEMVQSDVEDAHRRFNSNSDGKNSQVHPALARVPSELFVVCVVGTHERVDDASDGNYKFSVMSVSKPFLFTQSARRSAPSKRERNSVRTPPDFHSTLWRQLSTEVDAPIRWRERGK